MPIWGIAQLSFSTTQHDFGSLLVNSKRYVDIEVRNLGPKEIVIFSVRKPKHVHSLISQKRIAPDSTSIVRLQVNPPKKGFFNYEVQVFTSNQNTATIIQLKGDLNEYEPNDNRAFTACPSFSAQPHKSNPTDFKLKVITLDQSTQKELKNTRVTFVQKGQQVWQKTTNDRGEITNKAQLGLSYFRATLPGYFPTEKGTYINFKRNVVVLELQQDTLSLMATKSITKDISPAVNQKESIDIPAPTHTTPPVVESEKLTLTSKTQLHDLNPKNFDPNYFKPVNVVFILDVSSSMKQADRIELMKYALMQLTDMLRPEDQFSMITYASGVKLVLPPTPGNSKSVIQKEIETIHAGGFTDGGEGIKLGLKTALTSKINQGANHVIMITDGAFNRGSVNYKRQLKKYRRKGISFSVVGIKNNPKEEQAMRADALLGGGRYIAINQLSDAKQNLKKEIKMVSFKAQ